MRQLLIEDFSSSFQISESEISNGVFKLKGLFHLADVKNANGRIYTKKLIEREINALMPMVRARQVIGELDHPSDPMPRLSEASHIISDLKMTGNKVYGVLEALKTPNGRVLEGLIESGVKIGISSRGVGSLKEGKDGIKYVQEDYQLLTWDVVPNPSTPDAWLGKEDIMIPEEVEEQLLKHREDIYKVLPEIQKNLDEHKIKDNGTGNSSDIEFDLKRKLTKLLGGK